ncbi:hypothetical protein V498_10509, partial [Pseudogymnoascus sp. VKM F-4517 (FW-2822)]
MHIPHFLVALPPSLLLLSSYATSTHARNNGAALPPSAQLPEPRVIQKREEIAARIGAGMKPVAVRKMTEDEGEMFFNEYWGFEERGEEGGQDDAASAVVGDADVLRREYQEEEDDIAQGNSAAMLSFRPAFAIHEASLPLNPRDAEAHHLGASHALSALLKRAFQCPTGTSACTSISQPNYCCASSESCVSITDTGLGPVGCCPSGQSCAGAITHCAAGQATCPQSLGGACCVAGFVCFDVGCVSSVVVTSIRTVTQTPTAPTTTSRPPTTTTTTTPSTSHSVTTTEGPLPPVRGTGESSTVAPSPTSLTSDAEACPTGFYACSAYFPGAGCCRVGRDCAQTFCPTTPSVTVINGGVTVAVPEGSVATTATGAGKCASG